MAKKTKPRTKKTNSDGAVLSARCTKAQKKRIKDAEQSTGLNETDFVLTAVDEFLTNHKTPAEKIAAFSAYRLRQAEA